ncbi:putative disease resistance protein RGA4 [Panicum virgatum]|uniref:putative disease resistance protein RGA4 n=1 Tax=Panicum virgatum TaxID=38727 RepID=UPI0019D5BCDD|nr:putative disease resistance protein RGA4 [Panicum virgatum]
MAAVADAFASKLMGILQGMAKEEVEMLLGVPGEIAKLETTLGYISPILADAERRRIRDSAAERWMREFKDAMYDADDILDLCQILEGGEEPMLARRRYIPVFSCFSNQVIPHQIGMRIKALNQRLEDLAKMIPRFGFIISQATSSTSTTTRDSTYSGSDFRRETILVSDIIGEKIDEDRRKLCDLLVNEMDAPTRSVIDNVVVVAITGAAGIGKTTLAQMVFNDRIVQEHFEVKIWLSVTREFRKIRLLRQCIAYVDGIADDVEDTIGELEQRLHLAMREKKFLVVMDDVWSGEAWHILGLPLAPGSRVLVTTRNDTVAREMGAQHLHRVTTLDPDDSWLLLKKQVSD